MKKALLSTCLVLNLSGSSLFAQTTSPTAVPFTPVPFLTFSPDARSSGMGETGVASSPDANATFWNASKLAFSERDFGASASYTPWLPKLVDDLWLGYATVYKKIGKGQALVQRRQFALEDHLSGLDVDRSLPISVSFRRGMKVDMSMMFSNAEDIEGACPECHTPANAPHNTTVQWQVPVSVPQMASI